MDLAMILAGATLLLFFIPSFSPRHYPLFFTVIGILLVVGGGWAYYKQSDKDVAGSSTSPTSLNENKAIRYKGKTYTLRHLDGKDVYIAE